MVTLLINQDMFSAMGVPIYWGLIILLVLIMVKDLFLTQMILLQRISILEM